MLNTVAFSPIPKLCKLQHYLIPRYFHHPKGIPAPVSSHFLFPHSNRLIHFMSMNSPMLGVSYNGVIQYVAFWVWLFSFTIRFSKFIDIVACISTSFMIFRCLKILSFVYTFVNWWSFGLFLLFRYYEWYSYRHLHTGFCMDICFQFSWVDS